MDYHFQKLFIANPLAFGIFDEVEEYLYFLLFFGSDR